MSDFREAAQVLINLINAHDDTLSEESLDLLDEATGLLLELADEVENE